MLFIIICVIIDYVTVLDALQYSIDLLCIQQREKKLEIYFDLSQTMIYVIVTDHEKNLMLLRIHII